MQKPHPPIRGGGDWPGRLSRVAPLGDGWHATSKTPEEMQKSLGALRAAADAAGRSMSSIDALDMVASEIRPAVDRS